MRKQMEEDPAQIQNFKVKTADEEKYLGVRIVEGTVEDIINANIKLKASKVHLVATEIRQEVRDPRMERIGQLKAAALLIQAKIVPVLTYGSECWMNISEMQYAKMEKIMGEAIIRILSLPPGTVYDSLIMEVSNFHIEVWLDATKIKYFMKKIHTKRRGKLYRSLRSDIISGNEKGFIGDVRRLCTKYGLPDVTMSPVPNDYVSQLCREFSRKRSMMVSLASRKIPPMMTFSVKVYNDHYTYPKFEARAITCMRTGNLIFKNSCPWMIRKQHAGDPYCLFPPCREKDSLKHVLVCEYYSTKFVEKDGPTRDWATYLVALHQERSDKFQQPLIHADGWYRSS